METPLKSFTFDASLEWFDIKLTEKELVIYPKNRQIEIFKFNLDSGQGQVMLQKYGLDFFKGFHPRYSDEGKAFIEDFTVVLRNQEEHYAKH